MKSTTGVPMEVYERCTSVETYVEFLRAAIKEAHARYTGSRLHDVMATVLAWSWDHYEANKCYPEEFVWTCAEWA